LYDKLFLHHQIGGVLANVLVLVANRKGNLGLRAQTAQRKLPDERPFVNLFQESRAQHISNLKCGSNHALCQVHFRSVSIRGPFHRVPRSGKKSRQEGAGTLQIRWQGKSRGTPRRALQNGFALRTGTASCCWSAPPNTAFTNSRPLGV